MTDSPQAKVPPRGDFAAAAHVRPGRFKMMHALVCTARPKQWIKNLLVFAAPASAGQLTRFSVVTYALVAFAGFCLASSGSYFLNDAADVEADRHHDRKRQRPMAAGVFAPRTGRLVGAVLITSSLLLALATKRWQLLAIVLLYVANTTAYSTWLKHIAVLDVMSVAAGFLLRAIAGGVATRIPLSDWFLLVASFGSLYLVVGKRFAEHRAYSDPGSSTGHGRTRLVMQSYPREYLTYLRSVSSSALLVAYCLFALQKAQAVPGSFPWYQLSIVPFVGAVLRYALLIEQGHGEAPDELLLRDRAIQIAGLCWIVLFSAGVYLGS